jgi:hypothetical protein
MLKQQRGIARDLDSKQLYLQAKNAYFSAIKQAKRDYWNQFLEKEDPKSIYKALKYTKDCRVERIPTIQGEDSFQGKCKAFHIVLFPPPPSAPEPN